MLEKLKFPVPVGALAGPGVVVLPAAAPPKLIPPPGFAKPLLVAPASATIVNFVSRNRFAFDVYLEVYQTLQLLWKLC